ncbi:hypothetical protein [Algoriphagus winogradskyi]|jgi:hypothetical protein|uniref:Lipoprotein n=1 Tax=Algoriphagus winogradskyi TaxID=237017 RepID=A0ABY1PDJ9_9BACT|nr:hypothetical protein [Algoriphagus winogradskyi]SMP31862.1 hypothetical protein SAMN06265367_107225 [Algoriphagus winogradskyi]
MKKSIKSIASAFIGLILLVSCSGKEAAQSGGSMDGGENFESSTESVQDNAETLTELTPLTTEQFKAFFPETLIGLPQTSFAESFIPGIGTGSATYRTANKSIRIMIIDGAGAKGADAVGTYKFAHTKDYDEKGSWGYAKTIIHEGIKMKESGLAEDRFNWSLFYKDRFAIDIDAKEVAKEELDAIMKDLNLERLPAN